MTRTTGAIAEKYGLCACIQCGRCSSGCPVSLNSTFNIRRLVRELVVRGDGAVDESRLWGCSTCSTCSSRCPRGLKPHEAIISLRSGLVEAGSVPVTVRNALEGAFKHGNPWGLARNKRSQWASGSGIKDLSRGDRAEVLYFVGCAPSYDSRAQEVARALAKIFTSAGVDFGILGNEEGCCGNEIRRMGEEGLFEILRENNLAAFHKYGVTRIVTTSPHCYNALKNEYQDESLEVEHYTQLLSGLAEAGKIAFAKKVEKRVVYHDPCFLGKQNGVFDAPRAVLRSIPGVTPVEFDRSKERSLCCEGGGGRMWVENAEGAERLAAIRVRDAAGLGVQVLATACPFCLLNLEDAVKTSGLGEKLQVRDISELVVEAL